MAKRTLRWDELFRRLRAGPPTGTFAFCGPEAFLKQEALQRMVQALLGDAALERGPRYAVDHYELGEQDPAEILSAASQGGLFGGERVIWVEGFERATRLRQRERQALEALLGQKPVNPVVLVATQLSRELRQRSKGLARLLDATTVVDFGPPRAEDAARWLVRRAERFDVALTSDAARHIVEHLGTDLLTLGQEIEKITLLHGAGTLGIQDLRALVQAGMWGEAWDCVDAAVAGRARDALAGLQRVRRQETAFSLNWKLTYAANRALSGGRGRGNFGASRRAPTSGARRENLLGRMLFECYDWEWRMKSGGWSGTHGFDALEAVLIGHATRSGAQRARH